MKHSILTGTGLCMVLLLAACETNPNSRTASAVNANTLRHMPAGIDARSGKLSLADFSKILAYWDEQIQAQELEVLIARQKVISTGGAFEPIFYAEGNRNGELSQTSAADFLSQGTGTSTSGAPLPFEQQKTSGKVGFQLKGNTGITADLYYEMGKISNSLQAAAALPSPENSAALGLSFKAPLLRNAGKKVNTANSAIAKIDGEIAQETVRLIKTQRAFEAIKTYVFVQRSQLRVYWRAQTAELSAQLVAELENQLAQGLIDQSALTQAQSDLAERRGALTLARQELNEQIGAFQIYFLALDPRLQRQQWMPSDPLALVAEQYLQTAGLQSLESVYAIRPESRINALKIEREEVARMVAENQILPEANLVVDMKKTQLSGSYIPFRDVFSSDNPYQTWRVGFEFRRGLGGNIAQNAEYQAALLREQQADLTMRTNRQRVASELNGIGSILERARESLRYQNEVIAAQEQLLKTAEAKASSGNSSALDVLRSQINLSSAREARSDAIAQLNLSSYLASQVNGTLLTRLGISAQ